MGEHASPFLLSLLFEFLFFGVSRFQKKFVLEFRGNYFKFPEKQTLISWFFSPSTAKKTPRLVDNLPEVQTTDY